MSILYSYIWMIGWTIRWNHWQFGGSYLNCASASGSRIKGKYRIPFKYRRKILGIPKFHPIQNILSWEFHGKTSKYFYTGCCKVNHSILLWNQLILKLIMIFMSIVYPKTGKNKDNIMFNSSFKRVCSGGKIALFKTTSNQYFLFTLC